MRSILAVALLSACAWPQSPESRQSGSIQLKSIARQWQSVTTQVASAEQHRAQTIPRSATPPFPHQASSQGCDPLSPSRLEPIIRRAASRHGIQPALVAAVVSQESGGTPCVVSRKGAIGLMQLMPDTAASLGIDDPFEPEQNIEAGVRFLRQLIDRYHGDYALALSAYNAGASRVDSARGIPGIPETRAYVRDVIRRAGVAAISSETLVRPSLPTFD